MVVARVGAQHVCPWLLPCHAVASLIHLHQRSFFTNVKLTKAVAWCNSNTGQSHTQKEDCNWVLHTVVELGEAFDRRNCRTYKSALPSRARFALLRSWRGTPLFGGWQVLHCATAKTATHSGWISPRREAG